MNEDPMLKGQVLNKGHVQPNEGRATVKMERGPRCPRGVDRIVTTVQHQPNGNWIVTTQYFMSCGHFHTDNRTFPTKPTDYRHHCYSCEQKAIQEDQANPGEVELGGEFDAPLGTVPDHLKRS